jgi:GR25 family glycosyltransferase involved in LPS biosynthesis
MALENIRTSKTFVINLDRRIDRWDTFSKQPVLTQFTNLQRFSAIDGLKINIMEDTRISIHTRMNIIKKYRRSDYEICTPGAIGASLSHIGIWENFLKSDEKYLVVFEDDTIIDESVITRINKLIKDLPPKWDMWLLGHHRWQFEAKPLSYNPRGWLEVKNFTGAHAYILTRHGAELLLQQPFPIETHIEYYITGCSRLNSLQLISHPSLRMTYFAEQNELDDSDTFDTMKSCPVCVVPDTIGKDGVYIPYNKLARILVGVSALFAISVGVALGKTKAV